MRWSTPLLALGLAASLAACGGGEPEVARPAATTSFTAGDVPVLVPGAPGEQGTELAPGQSGTMANPLAYQDADVEFVRSMVPHHAQALEMARLAPERAQDERVRRFADRIAAGQGPEIDVMQAWLRQQGLPSADTDAGGHAHGGDMPGMATPEEMARLMASEGAAFDRLFLQLMTKHHQGAVTMAAGAFGATHPVVTELIGDVASTQNAEIGRMRELLAQLPA